MKLKRTGPQEPTQRQLRVGEQIRHALAEVFVRGESHLPGVDGASVTVSEVRISPDLKHAQVYISTLIGDISLALESLNEHSPYLRKLVSGKLHHMKFSPKLFFREDESFDEAFKIEKLLRQPDVARDLAPPKGEDE